MTGCDTLTRTRQRAALVAGPEHASKREQFCHTHVHASRLVNGPVDRARVGGSRFLQTDPIEGGSANDYDYVSGDPVNNLDLDGRICWTCGKRWLRAVRNVVNLPASAVGQTWAMAHGAKCSNNSTRNIVVCTGARGGYGRGGTTIGSVFITGEKKPDARLLRHEGKHANQWAWCGGGLAFPIAYAADEYIFSKGGADNHFERQAGLHDGCYRYRSGC